MKKKFPLPSVIVAVVIVAAVLVAFGHSLFLRTAPVLLPSPEDGAAQPGSISAGDTDVLRVGVTPETVQAVIATLSRPESYARTLTMEYFWGESGSGSASAQVWVQNDCMRLRMTQPDGMIRNVLVGGGRCCIWYDGGSGWYEYSAADYTADREQRIPTYEDILALDPSAITAANYVNLNGTDCIYVETAETNGSVECYWVDVTTGLLTCSETRVDGAVVYRVTGGRISAPSEANDRFLLPNGAAFPF
ncbi:MAG: hypothetical protein IKD96_04820 [Oscillospiraceae bacterium]|nr:hypothetical protein [Oscillospiraceae bacterium]